jgi:CRP-like cAMP-binding protein/ubiquinone/menaquinone biosynthesis C-methylase UbiE
MDTYVLPRATFAYLTPDDLRALTQTGQRRSFQQGDLIVEEGETIHGISVITQGRVRVVRTYMASAITIATIAEGEVFGEMGLVEGLPASASVYCDSASCEVFQAEAPQLDALLQSVPGMAIRFYRSLCTILSQRVREVSARIPGLMVEEVAQVQRVPETRTGRATVTQLPPSFVDGIDAFKSVMAMAEMQMVKEKKTADDVRPHVEAACAALRDGLREHVERNRGLADAIGAYAFRETFPFVMASHLNDRCFTKPRGYAGDFETINIIYEGTPSGDGRLGPIIDRWCMAQPVSLAVRHRRGTMMQHIARIRDSRAEAETVNVTSLAVGPGREFFDVLENDAARRLRITGVDIDPGSLEYVAARAADLGMTDRLRLVQGNIIRMALGKQKVEIPPQHFVYSLGLMDYLQDDIVVACLNWMYDMLVPGGEAMIGNFDTRSPEKAWMDYIQEWVLIHRTPEDLVGLFARSRFADTPVEVTSDTTNIQLFARCVKR